MDYSQEQIIAIAREDAMVVYGGLEQYEVLAEKRGENWFVRFELKDKSIRGGGPEYIISCETGEIQSKVYGQ